MISLNFLIEHYVGNLPVDKHSNPREVQVEERLQESVDDVFQWNNRVECIHIQESIRKPRSNSFKEREKSSALTHNPPPAHDSHQAPAQPPNHQAAAGSGRSEHRNVDILIPSARQRES